MNYIEKVERIDRHIREGSTGKAEDLAEKIGVSKRSVFNYIRWMKKRGAPIIYSRIQRSYIYRYDVEFVATFISIGKSGSVPSES